MIIRRKKLYQGDSWKKECDANGLDINRLVKVTGKKDYGMISIEDMPDRNWDLDLFEVIQK